MKKVLLSIISVYQQFISPLLHQLLGIKRACRYDITCSVYAKEVIGKYGAGKGFVLSLRRILSCQPFFSI
jgi:putative membrane protein insertion efficiency factor